MNESYFSALAKGVPVGKVPWFDCLIKEGLIEEWLNSNSADKVQYAVALLSRDPIIEHRDQQVASLMRNAFERSERDEGQINKILLRFFDGGLFCSSENLLSLYLGLIQKGVIDTGDQFANLTIRRIADSNPKWASRLLEFKLDQISEQSDPDFDLLGLPADFAPKIARAAPMEFVRAALSSIVKLITTHEVKRENGEVADRVWPILTVGPYSNIRESLLHSLRTSMGILAKQQPNELRSIAARLADLPHTNIAFLLLGSWSENGEEFADNIGEHFLKDTRRFNLGYGVWGSGNGIAAVARKALSEAAPFMTKSIAERVETAIMEHVRDAERSNPKSFGYIQYLLLEAFKVRLGKLGLKRHQELQRKFPTVKLEPPSAQPIGFQFVGSPIPPNVLEVYRDDQWIEAMLKLPAEPGPNWTRDGRFLGGALEVSRELERLTKVNKDRFVALLLKLTDEIPTVYFEAILRGLVARHDQPANPASHNQSLIQELSLEPLVAAFRRVHHLPHNPCGRWLCSCISSSAHRDLPTDILQAVCFYAEFGADPQEVGPMDERYYGGDLANYGINTTRGAAAQALGDLLAAKGERWPVLESAIRAVAVDRSWAVRAVAIHCIVAVLRSHRILAIELFFKAIEDARPVVSSLFVLEFVSHAAQTNYGEMRELLLSMLDYEDTSAKQAASHAIFLAGFQSPEANSDLQVVLGKGKICRLQVATGAAANLGILHCAPRCREALKIAFNDEERSVRDAAASCFYQLSEKVLKGESELIGAFIDSPAFGENASILLELLNSSIHRLPDTVWMVFERAIAIHRSDENRHERWWTGELASLVFRLYDQTEEDAVKVRCLDAIDAMIELGFGNISMELDKIERA